MKHILLALLLIPLASASTIQLDYPQQSNQENITFILKLNDFPADTYDVKIDIIQNDKRISRIWDIKWKSSMYYINGILSQDQSSAFLLTTAGALGEASIVVKIRNSKKKVSIFENYTIELLTIEPTIQEPEPEESEEQSEQSEQSEPEESPKESSLREPKQTNFTGKEFVPQVEKTIQLNPKTIKTEESSQKVKKGYAKYSILGFCILLFVIYKIKPKKKENEFAITKTKNQFDFDY